MPYCRECGRSVRDSEEPRVESYRLLTATAWGLLEESIEAMLSEGWTLYGDPLMSRDENARGSPGRRMLFAQAMVRVEEF